MALHAHGDGAVQLLLGLMAGVQTVALAVIADRSRRVRRSDRKRP